MKMKEGGTGRGVEGLFITTQHETKREMKDDGDTKACQCCSCSLDLFGRKLPTEFKKCHSTIIWVLYPQFLALLPGVI